MALSVVFPLSKESGMVCLYLSHKGEFLDHIFTQKVCVFEYAGFHLNKISGWPG